VFDCVRAFDHARMLVSCCVYVHAYDNVTFVKCV
jgi:hypothetical protein